jgi:hypothetical protein
MRLTLAAMLLAATSIPGAAQTSQVQEWSGL